jgi:hypothetical protein
MVVKALLYYYDVAMAHSSLQCQKEIFKPCYKTDNVSFAVKLLRKLLKVSLGD